MSIKQMSNFNDFLKTPAYEAYARPIQRLTTRNGCQVTMVTSIRFLDGVTVIATYR